MNGLKVSVNYFHCFITVFWWMFFFWRVEC